MSRDSFKVALEMDKRTIDALNRRILDLGTKGAQRALKSGFRRFNLSVRASMKAFAPSETDHATEVVRGERRPNVHIRRSIIARVRTYRGRIVWGGVGVAEVRKSYDTPHWYVPWVMDGHAIRGRRGGPPLGRAKPNRFIERAYAANKSRFLPTMVDAINEEIRRG